jgi:hypothetical protein
MGQHAWAGYLESPKVELLLWKSRARLKLAWEHDQKYPRTYPLNTSFALSEILGSFSKRKTTRSTRRLPVCSNPKNWAELISERIVKNIWEENHNGSYENALTQAVPTGYKDLDKSWKVFQGIIKAIEATYLVEYGALEFLAMPKVNILHKRLREIAKAAGIGGQTQKGFAEFLDDLCPCGLNNHREAVRKLFSRSTRMRRPMA